MQRILLYLIFGFFLFLIINWVVSGYTIIEGAETKGNPPIKCPEDCASVKEAQKKLSEYLSALPGLDVRISNNTQAAIEHTKAISEMNESLKEMQNNQSE